MAQASPRSQSTAAVPPPRAFRGLPPFVSSRFRSCRNYQNSRHDHHGPCGATAIVALGGDGEVTSWRRTVMKAKANKVRAITGQQALAPALRARRLMRTDALRSSRLQRYPSNVPRAAVELAKDWRSDRACFSASGAARRRERRAWIHHFGDGRS
jgi:hypothetical protein